MTTKYKLHIDLQGKETFTWDDHLYSVFPGTKSVIVNVSEAELIERLRSIINSNQFVILSMERL